MSLYFETAEILNQIGSNHESLKAKVYGNKTLKSPPASIYALASEATKWSAIITEVIEKSGILALEKKVCYLHELLSYACVDFYSLPLSRNHVMIQFYAISFHTKWSNS